MASPPAEAVDDSPSCQVRRSTATWRRWTSRNGARCRLCGSGILEVVPDAEQGLSYGMPAFKLQGKTVAGFAAFKRAPELPTPQRSVLAELGDTLGGYETSKGSLRFAVDKPLPERLVRQLVKTRMRELGLA
jgi:uncharacterized protein YdhG (YjbR/CyaY superfamily)